MFPAKDIYANLAHDGRMFSSAYATDEQLQIQDVNQCIDRPAQLLSTLSTAIEWARGEKWFPSVWTIALRPE